MKTSMIFRTTLIAFALASTALVATATPAAANPIPAECNSQPLGAPDGNGLDSHAKTFGNPVIYGACILALNVAGDALVLAGGAIAIVVDAANLVCDFATGQPCLDREVDE